MADKRRGLGHRFKKKLRQAWWAMRGGQVRRVFGEVLRFSPQTTYSFHRPKPQLPAGEFRSRIVAHGDVVQLHACWRYLLEITRPPIVFEVGAFEGVYAVLLGQAARKKGGKVLAFEPNWRNYEKLRDNVRRNGLEDTVICEPIALSDHACELPVEMNASESHVGSAASAGSPTVKCETIAQVCRRHGLDRIDLLIIDTEGAELPVLRGIDWQATRLVKVFCELHPYNWKQFGYTGEDFKAFLQQHNLRCLDMYLRELTDFSDERYVGPALLVSR